MKDFRGRSRRTKIQEENRVEETDTRDPLYILNSILAKHLPAKLQDQ
jgi:hypothetical protein